MISAVIWAAGTAIAAVVIGVAIRALRKLEGGGYE